MSSFKHLDNNLYATDQSYSTHLLNQLDADGRWVSKNWGTHTTLTYEAYDNDKTRRAYERPIVSVNEYAAFLRVPWALERDLESIHFRLLCRVSNGLLDKTDGESTLPNDHVMVRPRLVGDADPGVGYSAMRIYPLRHKGYGPSEWGWHEFSYDVGNLTALGGSAGYGTLVIGVQSRMPYNQTFQWEWGNDPIGLVNETRLDDAVERSNWRLKADLKDFYEEGSASGAPTPEANEITATALVYSRDYDTRYLRGWTGHLRKDVFSTDEGRSMQIWPPTSLHIEGTEEGSQANALCKFQVPYFQVRAVELWSEYA